MNTYLKILKTNFLVYVQYPLELFLIILKDIIKILFLLLFWKLIFSSMGNGTQAASGLSAARQDDLASITSYYLISGGLATLTMIFRQKFGSFLRKAIKSGEISNYIIKPLSILPAAYFKVWGTRGVYNVSALVSILVGLVISPPESVINIFLFLVFVAISFAIGFGINLTEGVLTLHMESPGGIMNSVAHMSRLLSGALVPLSYFPKAIAEIIQYLPFAVAIYSPLQSLRMEVFTSDVFNEVIIGIVWVFVLNGVVIYFWKKGLKKYEAVGL
jgi:ABC-2 type transport system permease protein